MIGVELALFPIVLALLLEKRAIKVYLLAMLLASIVGFSIYYFFPTTAPASVFFDKNFTPFQHDTFIKFFEIHHHLPITTTQGGLIAFPSFHVIWAALLAYSLKNRKHLFYPVLVFNAIVIVSTVFLGWHYLTDVIGGLTLAGLSVWAAEVIYKRYLVADDVTVINKTSTPKIRDIKKMIQLVPNPNIAPIPQTQRK